MPRHRHRLRPLALAVLGLTAGLLVAGCSEQQNHIFTLVNDSRAQAGLPTLGWNGTLATKAQGWAEHLAQTCSLAHSTLSDGAPANWQRLGENVGRGGTIDAIHTAYLNSPGHRANILDAGFTQVGTGWATNTCPVPNGTGTASYVFTVQEFMRPR